VAKKNTHRSQLWSAGGPGFSSATNQWATPPDFFAVLDGEFGFELDVCADATNAKCSRYFTVVDDGLAQDWHGVCWMNPPYGRGIEDWMRKAHESACAGATVVCLVPARTDTAWWHDFVMRADEVRLVRGRLHFGDSKSPAPFPSAVVTFRPNRRRSPRFRAMERPGTQRQRVRV
jgi:phage N-6-adenine-methyltransferase